MKKTRNDRKARRLELRKEILRNLDTADLDAVAGGLNTRCTGGVTNGGPCPLSIKEP